MSDPDLTDELSDADWYHEEAATFGDRLAGAREGSGLTQRQLADRLGIKHSTLRKWEDDLSEPRANRIQMLSGMLGVSLSWLLTGNGDGPGAPTDDVPMEEDARGLLVELRSLRTRIEAEAQVVAGLEKRLRRLLERPG